MKDILVHVDASPRAAVRIDAAIRLAQAAGARLTGLFAQSDADRIAATARRPSDHLRQAMRDGAQVFAQAVEAAGVSFRWMAMPHGEPSFVVEEFAYCARHFDLVVMGQTDVDSGRTTPAEMNEQVVLNSGRPVLTLPHYGDHPTLGRRVVCAWNAGREAARAVHDALPLLKTAEEVVVLSIRGGGPGPDVDLPAVDIVEHLRAHDVNVVAERLPDELIGKTDMLLSRACDLGADMLVMGAYGHYGLSRLRGSATRHMLRHMTLPLLLSH